MAVELSRNDVIAFRLKGHHLAERLDLDGLEVAAGRCGIQNSPPGSALLALHARVRDLTQEHLDHAVAGEKSLLQTWSMRGAPFYFPTADAPVFTTGVLPTTEDALRHFIRGVEQSVDKLGISVTDAVELTSAEIGDALSGQRLDINELGTQIAERIAPRLPKRQRAVWEEAGPYASGQPIGEAVVHFCIRILTLRRIVCFAPRAGNRAPFVLVDEWLGRPIPDVVPAAARGELLRRYLRCYGPATRKDFAAWVGLTVADTEPWWSQIEAELTQVGFGGTAWILTEDLDVLTSAPMARGVRLLPPRDPYTQLRDRETIVDRKYHRGIWRTVGDPGTVLVHGQITGTWRARKSGRRLSITITTFSPLSAKDRKALQDEAALIAPLRGASSVDVGFDTG